MKYPFVLVRYFFVLVSVIFPIVYQGCATVMSPLAYKKPDLKRGKEYFRGVFHVHSEHSEGSEISLKKIIEIAKKVHLDYVIIADHDNLDARKEYKTSDLPKYPLLIPGVESSARDGHLVILGIDSVPSPGADGQYLVDWAKQRGGHVVVAHPLAKNTPWQAPDIQGHDAIEVYNFANDAYLKQKGSFVFKSILMSPRALLRSVHETPERGLRFWKEQLALHKKMPAVIATDLHVKFNRFGFSVPNAKLQLLSTTLYVKAGELNERAVMRAITGGKSFMAFEFLGMADRFSFEILSEDAEYSMGDETFLFDAFTAHVSVPDEASILLFRDEEILLEVEGKGLTYPAKKPGAYRVEVYKKDKLWILSNPIYIH